MNGLHVGQARGQLHDAQREPDDRATAIERLGVTDLRYPNTVKDMVRNAVIALWADPHVDWFRTRTENQESIHNHGLLPGHRDPTRLPGLSVTHHETP